MRKHLRRAVVASAAFVIVGAGVADHAAADTFTYTIDPLQSALALTGNLTGSFASPQTTGGTTTSYSGTILAERVGNTIKFPDGSLLDAALQSSNQQPRNDGTPGSAPADYGRTGEYDSPFGTQTVFEALRNVQFQLFDDTSDVGTTVAGNGNFASNSFGLELTSGESDASYGAGINFDNDVTGFIANTTAGGASASRCRSRG
jgi:hypothetical protein